MHSEDSAKPAVGQQVITACAFIHYQFAGEVKVLMAKRADSKQFLPGVFELPGGHIDLYEDPVNGLVREIKEELQVDVSIGDPFYVFTYSNKVKGSHSIEVIYFAELTSKFDEVKINPAEHSGYDWFAESELHQATSPTKDLDNEEFIAIQQGFALLKGGPLRFS